MFIKGLIEVVLRLAMLQELFDDVYSRLNEETKDEDLKKLLVHKSILLVQFLE